MSPSVRKWKNRILRRKHVYIHNRMWPVFIFSLSKNIITLNTRTRNPLAWQFLKSNLPFHYNWISHMFYLTFALEFAISFSLYQLEMYLEPKSHQALSHWEVPKRKSCKNYGNLTKFSNTGCKSSIHKRSPISISHSTIEYWLK